MKQRHGARAMKGMSKSNSWWINLMSPHRRFHHQLYYHLLNMLHRLLQEVLHLLGKVAVANPPYNNVLSK